VYGEIEWLDPDGCPEAPEETLDLGSGWPAWSWLARATHWPVWRARPGRIVLAPAALVSVLTFGPSSPGLPNAGDGAITHRPLTLICTTTEPAAADAAPAARNLRGSLLGEQVQRPHGPGCRY
jgi:hypothetical protein